MTVSAGIFGWAIASPFASPSLLLQVQQVSQTYPEGHTNWISVAGAGLVALAGWLLWRWAKQPKIRFAGQMALALTAPPVALRWFGFNLLPQAGRYTLEMEAALAVLAVVLALPLLDRIRPIGRAGICLMLIAAASWQTIQHRRFANYAWLRRMSPAALAGLAIIFSLSCRRTVSAPSPPSALH